jgi:hypothetical protein
MPISDRDYMKGEHPPTCTCDECVKKRLGKIKHQKHYKFPTGQTSAIKEKTTQRENPVKERLGHKKIKNWLIALLLIFSLSIVGLGISLFVKNFIPLWVLLGFSIIYSVEKWFYNFTIRHKLLGKVYRLLLNLSILSLFGLIVWTGFKLFSHNLIQNTFIGALLFLFELICFIWIFRIITRNSWRQPSMKLTVFSLICLFLIFSFAVVQPMAGYKNVAVSKITALINEQKVKADARQAAEENKRDLEKAEMAACLVKILHPREQRSLLAAFLEWYNVEKMRREKLLRVQTGGGKRC